MKTIIRFVFTLLLFLPLCLSAQQTGVVKGRVFDSKNNEPISFANVVIWKKQPQARQPTKTDTSA